MKLSRPEPALIIDTIKALLVVGLGFGLPGLDDGTVAAITAFLVAVSAAVTAWHVKPVGPAIFTGVISAGAALLAAFGLDLSQGTVAAITVAVGSLMTLVFRAQVTPVSSPMPIGGSRVA